MFLGIVALNQYDLGLKVSSFYFVQSKAAFQTKNR